MTYPIIAPTIHYTVTVYLDGQPYTVVNTGWAKRSGLNQTRSSCTVELRERVDLEGGEPAYVDITANGVPRRFFTGFARRDISSVGSDSGLTYSYQIVDLLGALDRTSDSEIDWSNQSFPDAVQDVLTAAGISSSQVGDIYDPGSDYDLGTFDTITIGTDENLSTVIRELMEFGGCAIWVTPSGIVRVSNNTGIPVDSSDIAYIYGATTSQRGFYDVRQTFGNVDEIVASYTARGPERSDGTEPNATFTGTGITGRHEGATYRYAQSDTVCLAIATREVSRRARLRQDVAIETQFDPDLQPGQTIGVIATPFLDVSNLAFVEAINVEAHTMIVNCIVGPNEIAGEGYSEHPSPFADFSFTVEAELIDVMGTPTKQLIVQCDASTSYVSQGTISYSWSVSGATANPSSPTTVDPCFYIEAGATTGISITLTVSDGISTPSSVTKPLDSADVQTLTRVLSIARGGSGWRVLRNVDVGYEDFTGGTGTCDCTAKFSANGDLLSGWSSGELWAWGNQVGAAALLWTEPTTPTPTGIDHVYRDQGNPDSILVAADTKLYRSLDNGATFTLLNTFAAAIQDIESAPSSNYIRVCTGDSVQQSFDGGATFSAAQTGESGSTCKQQANAPWGNAACYLSATTTAGLVVFDDGSTVDWSAVTAPSPLSLNTITAALTEEAFYCGDTNGNLYKLTLSGGSYVVSSVGQTDAASGDTQDLIRDDRLNQLVFGADDWGSFKLLNGSDIFLIDGTSSLQIGIGPLAGPLPSDYILFVAQQGVASAGVYEYNGTTFTLRNSGIPAALTHVLWLSSNPLNDQQLIAVIHDNSTGRVAVNGGKLVTGTGTSTHSPLWQYDRATQTWSEIEVTGAPSLTGTPELFRADYDPETNGRWTALVESTDYDVYLPNGIGLTGSVTTVAATSPLRTLNLGIGQDGDTLINSNFPNDTQGYITTGGTLIFPLATTGTANVWYNGDVDANTRTLVVGDALNITGIEDYRSTGMQQGYSSLIGAPWRQPSVWPSSSTLFTYYTLPGIFQGNSVVYGTTIGVYQITNLFSGSPGYAQVAVAGENVDWLRVDYATRTLTAVVVDFSGTPEIVVWNGATEERLDISSLTNAAALVEIVAQ